MNENENDSDELTSIEDFEIERNGRYVRLSIDKISEEDVYTITEFLTYVIDRKIVPKVIFPIK